MNLRGVKGKGRGGWAQKGRSDLNITLMNSPKINIYIIYINLKKRSPKRDSLVFRF